jgi:membrane protease YdiL (CAAX protease family)
MGSKVRAVAEVAVVVILLHLFMWAWAASPPGGWEVDRLGANFVAHALFLAVPVAILLLARRSFRAFGLDLGVEWRASLKWGSLFAAALAAPPLLSLACGWLEIDVPRLWLSTVIFQVVFAGLCEEVLYRGYYQSRINGAFGRPFVAGGIRFGVGLVFVSLLFAFGHVLNPFNPFQGSHALDWTAGLVALQTALFYGLVREKTGSILAPALIHGSTVWWSFLLDDTARYVAMGIGWSICWVLLFTVFSQKKMAGDAEPAPEPIAARTWARR